MAWQINCEDGIVVRGETEDELFANVQAHVREYHPDLPEMTREQALGLAVQV